MDTLKDDDARNLDDADSQEGYQSPTPISNKNPPPEIPSEYLHGCDIFPFKREHLTPEANTLVKLHQLCVKFSDFRENTFLRRQELDYRVDPFGYIDLDRTPMENIKITHHENVGELALSAAAGCHLCSLLLATMSQYGKWKPNRCVLFFAKDPHRKLRYQLFPNVHPDPIEIIPGLYISSQSNATRTSNWCAITTASSDLCSWAQAKMKRCLSSCISCGNIKSESAFLPSRLLALWSVEESGRIRLVSPTEIPLGQSQYITLSYCWGSDQPIKLIHNTMSAFTSGIDTESLPKSHRDAIQICQWFDVRYLWIDACVYFRTMKKTGIARPTKWGLFTKIHT